MKTILIAAIISSMSAMSAFAADSSASSFGYGPGLEQHRVKMLQHIEQRISASQQEKTCVQAAQSEAELMTCREKFRPPKPRDNQRTGS